MDQLQYSYVIIVRTFHFSLRLYSLEEKPLKPLQNTRTYSIAVYLVHHGSYRYFKPKPIKLSQTPNQTKPKITATEKE